MVVGEINSGSGFQEWFRGSFGGLYRTTWDGTTVLLDGLVPIMDELVLDIFLHRSHICH